MSAIDAKLNGHRRNTLQAKGWLAAAVFFAALAGCALDPREVVVSTIDITPGWSMDAAQYMTHVDRLDGSQLLLSATVVPGRIDSRSSDSPLMFRLFVTSVGDVRLEPFTTVLNVDEKNFSPVDVRDCESARLIGARSVSITKEPGASQGDLCLLISFKARRPASWSGVSLRISGLKKDDRPLVVPEIHYRTQRTYFASCGTPAGRRGLFCENGD